MKLSEDANLTILEHLKFQNLFRVKYKNVLKKLISCIKPWCECMRSAIQSV